MSDDDVFAAVAELLAYLEHAPFGRYLLIPGFGGFAVSCEHGPVQLGWCPDVELNAIARGDAAMAYPDGDASEAILAEWRAAGIDADLAPVFSPLPALGRLMFDAIAAGGSVEIERLGRFAVVASPAGGGNVVRFTPARPVLDLVARRSAARDTVSELAL